MMAGQGQALIGPTINVHVQYRNAYWEYPRQVFVDRDEVKRRHEFAQEHQGLLTRIIADGPGAVVAVIWDVPTQSYEVRLFGIHVKLETGTPYNRGFIHLSTFHRCYIMDAATLRGVINEYYDFRHLQDRGHIPTIDAIAEAIDRAEQNGEATSIATSFHPVPRKEIDRVQTLDVTAQRLVKAVRGRRNGPTEADLAAYLKVQSKLDALRGDMESLEAVAEILKTQLAQAALEA